MRVASLLALVAIACNNDPSSTLACHDVPDGGCPTDNGADVCSDVTCAAAYACVNGAWVFQQKCPSHPHDASTVEAAATDGPSTPDVAIDAPPGSWGGPGCTDLQPPDCSLGTALACGASCCDCMNLYVCQNGGWNPWGSCGDAGIVAGGR